MKGLLLVCLLVASSAQAQPLAIDRAVTPWAVEHQSLANTLSTVTVWSTVGVDAWQSWQSPDRKHAFIRQGVRLGIVQGASFALKKLVTRDRPCEPTNSCGRDNPHYAFPSGHAATAFVSISPHAIAISVPLAAETGALRVAAGRHWLTDVLAGAGVGIAVRAWMP